MGHDVREIGRPPSIGHAVPNSSAISWGTTALFWGPMARALAASVYQVLFKMAASRPRWFGKFTDSLHLRGGASTVGSQHGANGTARRLLCIDKSSSRSASRIPVFTPQLPPADDRAG